MKEEERETEKVRFDLSCLYSKNLIQKTSQQWYFDKIVVKFPGMKPPRVSGG